MIAAGIDMTKGHFEVGNRTLMSATTPAEAPTPRAMPMAPPMLDSTADSTRNWRSCRENMRRPTDGYCSPGRETRSPAAAHSGRCRKSAPAK